jgi:hypothetical protein
MFIPKELMTGKKYNKFDNNRFLILKHPRKLTGIEGEN